MYRLDAFSAGLWAACGSTLAKFLGSQLLWATSKALGCLVVILMVMANTWGCRSYMRALDTCSNSVVPTIISSSTTFVMSALIGVVVFGDKVTSTWWVGSACVCLGVGIICHSSDVNQKYKNKLNKANDDNSKKDK